MPLRHNFAGLKGVFQPPARFPAAGPPALRASCVKKLGFGVFYFVSMRLLQHRTSKTPCGRISHQAPKNFAQSAISAERLSTHTIQFLSDQLTFNCLNYINGVIDSDQSDFLFRGTQRASIALLAAEQLTGSIRAQGATVVASLTAEAKNQKPGQTEQTERKKKARMPKLSMSWEGDFNIDSPVIKVQSR